MSAVLPIQAVPPVERLETLTVPHSAWFSFQRAVLRLSLCIVILFPWTANSANLKTEALKAWEEYVDAVNAQVQERLVPDHPFVLSDEDPGLAAKLRSGEIVVSPAGPHITKRVPSGLIHDWNGEAFIPNATLHDVARRARLWMLQRGLQTGCDRFQSHCRQRIGRRVLHAPDEQIAGREDCAR